MHTHIHSSEIKQYPVSESPLSLPLYYLYFNCSWTSTVSLKLVVEYRKDLLKSAAALPAPDPDPTPSPTRSCLWRSRFTFVA